MSFEQLSLDPRLLAAVRAAGYVTPTPIQQQAIPAVLANQDVLGLAQTGTGKTAAFMLPILQRLLQSPNTNRGHVRVLVVAPTRELAEQIQQATVSLAANTRIRSVAIYGGVSKRAQVAALRRGAEIVIACPGRLLDHVGDRNIDLTKVEVLVLDEADHMCDMGFLPDIRRILRLVPDERQTLFFSATMPDEIRSLADGILANPTEVQVDARAPVNTVSHALYPVPEGLKLRLLLTMLDEPRTGRVLIFTRTKRRARNIAEDLERSGHRVAALQGNMAQNQRQAAINGFRSGEFDVLVATDIAARGIDVPGISHVINYDMPDTVDAYTHRIGRTGRAHAFGEALTYVLHEDESTVRAIEKVLGARIERRRHPSFDYGSFSPESPTPMGSTAQLRPMRGGRGRPQSRPQSAPRPQSSAHPRTPEPQRGQPAPAGSGSRTPAPAPAARPGRSSARRWMRGPSRPTMQQAQAR